MRLRLLAADEVFFDLLFEDLKNGKEIAAIINLPEPNLYTWHCWRSTSSMWAANAGCSIGQIKALKGHKVDTAVQGCIQLSDVMRHKVADAVILLPKSQNVKQNVTMKQKALPWLRQDQTKNEQYCLQYYYEWYTKRTSFLQL